jgi:hypothetical protein
MRITDPEFRMWIAIIRQAAQSFDRMARLSILVPGAAVLCLCILLIPVCAVVQEVTLKGGVSTMSQPKNTLTVDNAASYGCVFKANGASECSWTPMTPSALTGTVPDPSAFTVFKTGDTIVATSLGGAGETWITLAKLYGSRPNEAFVTDIVGDIRTVPVPLIGNYALDATTVPDCSTCKGTTCTASSVTVKVSSEGKPVFEKSLKPGESFTYNGRNDGSSVAVTFVKGEALSESCPNAQKGIIGGVQPVSMYIVKVVPPIGFEQVNIRTPSTTETKPAGVSTLEPASVPPGTAPAGTVPATTQKSPVALPVLLGALPLAGLAWFAARRR